MNADKSFTIESVSFVNCDFIGLTRGTASSTSNQQAYHEFCGKGCRFDKCGWQTGSYGLMDLRSFNDPTAYDQVDKAVFRNCTFSRDNDGTTGFGWGNLFNAPYIDKPIQLELRISQSITTVSINV